MLKKPLAFGLVAAAMLIAPTAAIADDQWQYNEQRTYQNGAAIDRSTNVQTSETRSYQQQTQINDKNYRDGYYRPYRRYRDGDYYRRDRDYDYYRRRYDYDDDFDY
ncbi:MAG: hypothetical protein N2235_21500 [Fischerella sp.]|nr:hypothetical protein [Fischerella sp.]